MNAVLYVLIAQGFLGAADVLINHELREGLPNRPSATTEEFIHGVREVLYAVVFAGLAWFEWHGFWVLAFTAVLAAEVLLTAWDFVEEDRTRVLSPTERVMHLCLSMGGGAYCALLIPALLAWSEAPTALQPVTYGWISWLLTLMGAGVFAWGLRDLASSARLYLQIHTSREAS